MVISKPAVPPAAAPIGGRDALLALRQSRQRYRFLNLAYRYLAQDDDPLILLEVVKTLVEIGLGGPARELLQDDRRLEDVGIETAGLRRSIASVPTGRVPWQDLEGLFATNLEALRRCRPYLRAGESELRGSLRGLKLFGSLDGLLHLSRREPGRLRQWLPALIDASGVATMEIPIQETGPVPVVTAIGLDALIERVYEVTRAEPGAAHLPIYVVDDELYRVAAWLHAADRTSVLDDPRVHFFVGPDAIEKFEWFLTDNEDMAIPGANLWTFPVDELCRKVGEIDKRIVALRNKASRELEAAQRARATRRSTAAWARRLEPGASVIGITSRFTTMLQYSMRDIGLAFEALGYRFKLVIEKADHRCHTTLTTSRAVHDADPALIVLINHFRHEQPDSLGASPMLTWIQDPTDVVLSKHTGASIGPLDFVCGYYHQRCTGRLGYPASRFFGTPLPVSTRTFHDRPVASDDAARYACDLMYVGHQHADADEHLARWRSMTPAPQRPLLEAIRDEVIAIQRRGEHLEVPRSIVRRLAGDLALDLDEVVIENISNYFAYRLYDILFRRETLGWAAEWAADTGRVLKLYGRGWARDPVLGRFAAGPIEHGEPLRRAYRCATLALQTIPGGFMHQRAYEALVSGCTVLGRRVPPDFVGEGSAHFFPALDRVVFRGARELAELAERYLGDETLRREVHREFVEVVHRDYTYLGVVGDLIEKIRGALDRHSCEEAR